MLIRRLLDAPMETLQSEGALQPVRIDTLPAELTSPASANERERILARRAWRRQRNARRSSQPVGGWSLRAW